MMNWYPWLHLGLYQVTWFAAISGGAASNPWPGVLMGVAMLVLHVSFTAPRMPTVSRLLQATLLGVSVDTLLTASGAVSFTGCACVVPPAWMVVLWPCFASLFDDLLRWVPQRPWLAVGLGAVGGPLAYLGGDALGALAFPWGLASGIVAVGIAWALATWVLVLIWRGVGRTPSVVAT